MKASTPWLAPVRAGLRRARWHITVLLSYLVLKHLFVVFTADRGVFFQLLDGRPLGLALVAMALVVVALRLAVYWLLPAIITYQIVVTSWERWTNRAQGRPQ